MPNPFNLATVLSIQVQTRDPGWLTQAASPSPLLPPESASYGAVLGDAPAALIFVALREETHRRTCRLVIPTLNISDTFTVTVAGNAVAYDSTGDADLDEVVSSIAAAINADGSVNGTVTASAVNASTGSTTTNRDTVVVRGDGPADYSIDFARTGTSVIAASADAARCDVVPWWLMTAAPAVTPPPQWVASPSREVVAERGYVDRFHTGGFLRSFVQVANLGGVAGDGTAVSLRLPDIRVGPGLPES